MRRYLVVALAAMLLVSLAPAMSELMAPSALPAAPGAFDQATEPGDATPSIAASSRPDHAARLVRTVRAPRRILQAKLALEPLSEASTSGASQLERRRAELPPQYFLLHHRTAPRAPALS